MRLGRCVQGGIVLLHGGVFMPWPRYQFCLIVGKEYSFTCSGTTHGRLSHVSGTLRSPLVGLAAVCCAALLGEC